MFSANGNLLHKTINDFLWQRKVIALLRETNHLRKNPGTQRKNSSRIHLVGVNLVGIVPSTPVAGNLVRFKS